MRLRMPQMYERTLVEYVHSQGLDNRIQQIERWVAARPESCIVLVAHGQLFQRAVGLHPDNVGVIECSWSDEQSFHDVKDLGVLAGSAPAAQ